MNFKQELAAILHEVLDHEISQTELELMIEKPKNQELGDLAFPCFTLAKVKRKSPNLIAEELSKKINSPIFEKVEVVGAYLNLFLNKKTASEKVVNDIISAKGKYGALTFGNGGAVTIDMSSPNIAKPFSMGHLRSTVIGNSLALIVEKCGYKPIKINHLGDWGTQFGKLITAYQLWGNAEKVKQNPIKELLTLYIKFHEEAETNPSLEDQGRSWFKRLEDGDEQALKLWKWFRDESLKEFSRIYQLMNVEFDSYAGEAFYNDKMERVVKLLEEKQLLVESEQAQVVELTEEQLPPCLIKKSDGATLYATRDLAAALYRQEEYQFVQSLYVVGHEQSLHFKQLMAVLAKMGYDWSKQMHHIPFGLMLKDGKKMSTRKGKVVLLEEVLNESIAMARHNIEVKNPNLTNKEDVAKQVGVGAVIFHDLKNNRMNDIEFSLEEMLRFEGETGPYVQYTYARACSILRKADVNAELGALTYENTWEKEWKVTSLLMEFSPAIRRACINFDPSQVAKYVIDLAQAFNKYYAEVKILEDTPEQEARLALVYAVTEVLKEGLRLLGLEAPVEM
ncbi:arginine--tRNA ligase [Bacillus sp. ISL-40]|uniref:arginine--tRNA ligase n=1 Tax=unclassified Bacillus (in: firmicutes) TaxID=185979 RepID=UPI001BEBB5CA|nr:MULTISPECIES: arginine--tRNA ligase [unclassified Bacillus (in: firmicutes)]MBT2699758.1 arginine--tRNA ligase [Bacillus sp. ISL-40]MBT2722229.1 arginine--tRNA ligase [Bacillus sp. ISL-46]MBT2740648.1 arginine--tRNA ligase [Bacillus sp. ISL-77]